MDEPREQHLPNSTTDDSKKAAAWHAAGNGIIFGVLSLPFPSWNEYKNIDKKISGKPHEPLGFEANWRARIGTALTLGALDGLLNYYLWPGHKKDADTRDNSR